MALNITEAHAINALIGWLLAKPNASGNPRTEADAITAAELLTRRAHSTLHAGLTPDQVRELWAKRTDKDTGDESTTDRVRLNGPQPLKPSDLPEDGKIEVINSSGEWAAYYFADTDRVYDGSGGGESIEEACRQALENAE